MGIPGFAVSILPGPPPVVVEVPAATSLLAWDDFDVLLTVLSESDDEEDDEYRSKLGIQHRDVKSNCETGRKLAAWYNCLDQMFLADAGMHKYTNSN